MDHELPALIGQLYDAALDPELWTSALQSLDGFFHTQQSMIALEDATNPTASQFYASIDDPEWLDRYVNAYMMINPMRLAVVSRAKAGDVVLTKDFMTPAEYSATRFSKEFLAERCIADIAVSILDMTATRITVLSAQRSFEQGFADEILRRKLQIVMPHAQRAVQIARLLEHRKMASSNFADTLDTLAAAVFLLTGSRGIVHVNTQAAAFLDDGDLVQSVRGALVLCDRVAGAALVRALERAQQGEKAPAPIGDSIPATSQRQRKFVVTVMPLNSGSRRSIFSPYDAVAAVCIKEAGFEPTARGFTSLAALYDLTPRELTMLVASVEFGNVPEVAAVMGIAQATVKSHLKSLFRKTGASRQADLVKLVAGVTSPFSP